jgi:hypothetical protein
MNFFMLEFVVAAFVSNAESDKQALSTSASTITAQKQSRRIRTTTSRRRRIRSLPAAAYGPMKLLSISSAPPHLRQIND